MRRAGEIVSVSDLAIVAALVFGWGALSARLERFEVTAPITFVVAGLLLTHGPLPALASSSAAIAAGACASRDRPVNVRRRASHPPTKVRVMRGYDLAYWEPFPARSSPPPRP
jgi:hypothetical protein